MAKLKDIEAREKAATLAVAVLLGSVEHELECDRVQRGLVNTSPGDCNCHIHAIAQCIAGLGAELKEAREKLGAARSYVGGCRCAHCVHVMIILKGDE